MDQSREQILADFQACTGLEDMSLAIQHLDDCNWILVDAVNHMLALREAGQPHIPHNPEPTPPSHSLEGSSVDEMGSSVDGNVGEMSGRGGGEGDDEVKGDEVNGERGDVAGELHDISIPMMNRRLEFNVSYEGRDVQLQVEEQDVVGTLKQMLQGEFSIQPCHQKLLGWASDEVKSDEPDDDFILAYLHLPSKNHLFLCDTAANLKHQQNTSSHHTNITNMESSSKEDDDTADDTTDCLNKEFRIYVKDVDNDQSYTFSHSGSKTIKSIKQEIFHLTLISSRHQVWTGWPDHADDNTTLSGCQIPSNHHLTVRRKEESGNGSQVGVNLASHHVVSKKSSRVKFKSHTPNKESSAENDKEDIDDYYDDDDDDGDMISAPIDDPMVMESLDDADISEIVAFRESKMGKDSASSKSLLPDGCDEEVVATQFFAVEFAHRYLSPSSSLSSAATTASSLSSSSEPHPIFYIGTLGDALRDSFQTQSIDDRKLLAIYLHNGESILANVFCAHSLCADSVLQYLATNFVVWPWDVTLGSNRERLLQILTQHLGVETAATVRSFNDEQYPVILIIAKHRGGVEVLTTCQGNTLLDELMTTLLNASELFEQKKEQDRKEEDERQARQSLIDNQMQHYEQSLQADRKKEEERKVEEEKKRVVLEEKRVADERQREKEEEVMMEQKALRQSLAETLPEEPKPDAPQNSITSIRIKTPSGEQFERRFNATDSLHALLNFVRSKGFSTQHYKVIRSWPRKDMTDEDETKTLDDLGLVPQETLVLSPL